MRKSMKQRAGSKKHRERRYLFRQCEFEKSSCPQHRGCFALIVGFFFLLPAPSSLLHAQIPSGQEVIDKMSDVLSPTNSKGVVSQTIVTSSGKIRTFEFEMYSANQGEKTLIRYIKPTSVKGQAFLMLNNSEDIWTYFPRTKRVRKLASHAKKQKVQGGDFTFEDFSSSDTWKEDYVSTNLGEVKFKGQKCWKLQADETESNESDYPQVILYIRRSDYHPIQMDFYDDKQVLAKSLYLENIEMIDNYPTARTMIMKNHLKGSETRMEIKSISYNWNPPKGFFSERNLKK